MAERPLSADVLDLLHRLAPGSTEITGRVYCVREGLWRAEYKARRTFGDVSVSIPGDTAEDAEGKLRRDIETDLSPASTKGAAMAEALHAGCPAGVSQTPDRCPPDTSDDDPWGDVEPCPDCGRERCDCDCDMDGRDSEHCRECLTYGAIQCSIHSDGEIEAMRAEHEYHATREALESLLAMPHAWTGRAWDRLRSDAGRVLAEMRRRDGH